MKTFLGFVAGASLGLLGGLCWASASMLSSKEVRGYFEECAWDKDE